MYPLTVIFFLNIWSSGAQIITSDGTLRIVSPSVRTLALQQATCSTAQSSDATRICLPDDATIEIGPFLFMLENHGSRVSAWSQDTRLWSCSQNAQCAIGHYEIQESSLTTDRPSIVVTGMSTTSVEGIWVSTYETVWRAHGESTALYKIQNVCMAGNIGICGVRLAATQADQSIVMLNSGEIVVGSDVPSEFVAANIGKYSIITQSVVAAVENIPPPLYVTPYPVLGINSQLRMHLIHPPSICGRYRLRDLRVHTVNVAECLEDTLVLSALTVIFSPLIAVRSAKVAECSSDMSSNVTLVTLFANTGCDQQSSSIAVNLQLGQCFANQTTAFMLFVCTSTR